MAHHGNADSVDLPRRHGIPAQRRAEPPDRDAARADRRAQGARLRQPRARRALPLAGNCRGGAGHRPRHWRRHLVRRGGDGLVRALLSLPELPLRDAAGGGRRRHRRHAARRRRGCDGRRAQGRHARAGRGDAPARARRIPANADGASGLGPAAIARHAHDDSHDGAAAMARGDHHARHRLRDGDHRQRHVLARCARLHDRRAIRVRAARSAATPRSSWSRRRTRRRSGKSPPCRACC